MRDFWRRQRRAASASSPPASRGSRGPVRRLAAATDRVGQPHHRARRLHAAPTWCPTTRKHNEANGEDNRDGTDDNRSWNCGVEGPTDDPEILALRARQSRALLTTLLLSFGVPLLLGGDELGRTQRGNNNAYCQDNAITWFDWSKLDDDLLAFTRRLIALRRAHPVFRRRRFLVGMEAAELRWFTPAAKPMTTENWADPDARCLAIYLDGDDAPDRAEDGTPLLDDDFLVLVNGWWEPLEFVVPDVDEERTWRIELDTYDPGRRRTRRTCTPATTSRSARSPSRCSAARSRRPVGTGVRRCRASSSPLPVQALPVRCRASRRARAVRARVGLAAGELGNTELSQAYRLS